MPRHTFPLKKLKSEQIKLALLNISERFDDFSFLDSNDYPDKLRKYDWLCGWQGHKVLETDHNSFDQLKTFCLNHQDWMFGHLNYNLKNEVEKLQSHFKDDFGFTPLRFFIPKHVIYSQDGEVWASSYSLQTEEAVEEYLNQMEVVESKSCTGEPLEELKPTLSKEAYLRKVRELQEELQYGNIYEINFCQEFKAQRRVQPISTFKRLNELSKAPFSAYYKMGNNYLLCASPERFLQKERDEIRVQPIKGTARRFNDPTQDKASAEALLNSEKERSENVMIVDLMRNDLSRTATNASVKVDELFGLYSFQGVHQLISTVRSTLDKAYTLADVLHTTFPMGSMTGAPKESAMQLIDQHENFNRGLFSGSVGYIDPSGNADFNVVIRSLLYNASRTQLSIRVGGAITVLSTPEAEYEECLLKAEKLFAVLR
jgi:para-aminobenzoate synthetase component 1